MGIYRSPGKSQANEKRAEEGGPVDTSKKDNTSADKDGTYEAKGAKPKTRKSMPLEGMTVDQLKDELRKLSLSTSGRKKELRERLRIGRNKSGNCLTDSSTEDVNDGESTTEARTTRAKASSSSDSSDQENEDEDVTPPRQNQRTRRERNHVSSNLFTIKDVEGSMSHFSGDDEARIELWIDEFEDTSTLLQWNDKSDIRKKTFKRFSETVYPTAEGNHVGKNEKMSYT